MFCQCPCHRFRTSAFIIPSSNGHPKANIFSYRIGGDILAWRFRLAVIQHARSQGLAETMKARDSIYGQGDTDILLDLPKTDEGYAVTFNALYIG